MTRPTIRGRLGRMVRRALLAFEFVVIGGGIAWSVASSLWSLAVAAREYL